MYNIGTKVAQTVAPIIEGCKHKLSEMRIMDRYKYNVPNHEKVIEAITRQGSERPALILLLAYHAAMTVNEMQSLRWENISADFTTIHMDDGRNIPMTPELISALQVEALFGNEAWMPVLYSKRTQKAYTRMQISRWAREALQLVGIGEEIRLTDLRVACILNWLQQYPWKYVSQISGMEMNILTQRYKHYMPADFVRKPLEPLSRTEISEELIESIYNKHSGDLLGFILFIYVKQKISLKQLCELTWDKVDLETATIFFPHQEAHIPDALLNCLFELRANSNSPYVLAYPNTNTPNTSETITHMAENIFIEEDHVGITLKLLRRAHDYLYMKRQIMNAIDEKGTLTNQEAYDIMGVKRDVGKSVLDDMEREGLVNYIGIYYYDGCKTVSPTKFMDVIHILCEEKGKFSASEFATAIGIPPRSAATQLRRLIKEGQIEMRGNYYIIK